MNRLSDKQLKQMIREALSRIEADCIAQHSPMAGLGMVGFMPSGGPADTTMPIGVREVKYMIREVLTTADETSIKKMIAKELSASQTDIGKSLKKAVEVELSKAIKSKEMKDDVAEITKKILKRLYKDLSLQQPYVIDRIKV